MTYCTFVRSTVSLCACVCVCFPAPRRPTALDTQRSLGADPLSVLAVVSTTRPISSDRTDSRKIGQRSTGDTRYGGSSVEPRSDRGSLGCVRRRGDLSARTGRKEPISVSRLSRSSTSEPDLVEVETIFVCLSIETKLNLINYHVEVETIFFFVF